jgi:hypothetical protein
MASMTGKKARRVHGGNRFSVARRKRHARASGKTFTNDILSPESYRQLKKKDR